VGVINRRIAHKCRVQGRKGGNLYHCPEVEKRKKIFLGKGKTEGLLLRSRERGGLLTAGKIASVFLGGRGKEIRLYLTVRKKTAKRGLDRGGNIGGVQGERTEDGKERRRWEIEGDDFII